MRGLTLAPSEVMSMPVLQGGATLICPRTSVLSSLTVQSREARNLDGFS
jgi:hypothetical protein